MQQHFQPQNLNSKSNTHKQHSSWSRITCAHSQTHKQVSSTKMFRGKKLPLLCHLWGKEVTSLSLICHTHPGAFFCRTTWSLCRGQLLTSCLCVAKNAGKVQQKCFYLVCCVLEKFLEGVFFFFYFGNKFLWRSEQKAWFGVKMEENLGFGDEKPFIKCA